MIRTFTGWHMLAITVSFFAVVLAVNLVMARFAVSTFGGTVVDNSYVASQKYNRWLDEADAQRALGWRLSVHRQGDRVELLLNGVSGANVEASAIHPLGRLPQTSLHFARQADGRFRSVETLPAGRWRLELLVRSGRHQARFIDEVAG